MPKREDGKPRRRPGAARGGTRSWPRQGNRPDRVGGPQRAGRPSRPASTTAKGRQPPSPDRAAGRSVGGGRGSRDILEEIRRMAKPGTAVAAAKAFEDAVALLERGRDAAAVAPAREAKGLAPRSGAVREVLGLALYRAGRFADALGELQADRRITGRIDHNHLIADCYRAA